MDANRPQTRRLANLAYASGFVWTRQDLEANRDGALSEAQREWFNSVASYRLKLSKALGVAGLVLGLFFGLMVVCLYSSPVNQLDGGFLLICLFLALPLLFSAGGFINVRRFHAIAIDPASRAESVAGTVKIKVDQGIYQIRIDRTRVNGDASGLVNGDSYVIYYEPHSMQLLSAERVGKQ
jgi:hypothetical protein